MAERVQEQRLQKRVANCDQVKSELKRPQRRQQAVASGKEKKRTTTEPTVTRSRSESRMEVDEAPRAGGRFNLDRPAQENMNEGLEAWTTPEPVPSLRNLEANPVRPLMEISLPGLTPSSTSSSQTGTGTSRLRELQEKLQSRAREISTTTDPERSPSEERSDLELQEER